MVLRARPSLGQAGLALAPGIVVGARNSFCRGLEACVSIGIRHAYGSASLSNAHGRH